MAKKRGNLGTAKEHAGGEECDKDRRAYKTIRAASSPASVGERQNMGHGHVFPRPDGIRMRCGGPGICSECSKDKAALIVQTKVELVQKQEENELRHSASSQSTLKSEQKKAAEAFDVVLSCLTTHDEECLEGHIEVIRQALQSRAQVDVEELRDIGTNILRTMAGEGFDITTVHSQAINRFADHLKEAGYLGQQWQDIETLPDTSFDLEGQYGVHDIFVWNSCHGYYYVSYWDSETHPEEFKDGNWDFWMPVKLPDPSQDFVSHKTENINDKEVCSSKIEDKEGT